MNSLNTTFSRIFIFSIVLTLVISVFALLAFRYFAAEYTAPYQAQSMVAKYQLIETSIGERESRFIFDYLVEAHPAFSDQPLAYYFDNVLDEIRGLLSTDVALKYSQIDEEVYIWFKSSTRATDWIGVQLSHKNPLILYYGWAYIAMVFLVSVLPVYFFARTISGPIATLSDAAESIASGGTPKIEPKWWPREISLLAKMMNIASVKLKDQTKAKEYMLLGISHDLRTPLTRARLAIDFLEKHDPDLVASMVEDFDEMNQIIDQFIVYAREGRLENKEPIAINDLVQDVSNKFPNICLKLADPFIAHVSPLSFRRLLSNLVSNACKYGKPPIEIWVNRNETSWSVTVIDGGNGIPDQRISEVVKPFTTLDDAGTNGKGGLGLAIVDRIVRNYGGVLRFYKPDEHHFAAEVSFDFEDHLKE